MLRRFTFAACVVCTALTPTFAQKPTADEQKLAALIEKLGAADFREREKAQRDLIALGDKARPLMKRIAVTTENAEIERRLEVMIAKLEREELHQPKRVTYIGNATIVELLKEIESQTGYKINGGTNDTAQKLKVDWKNRPFWEALDEVTNAAGLSVQMYDDGAENTTLSVYSNDTFDPHVSHAGPFRFVATNIGMSQNRQLSGLARKGLPAMSNGSLALNLSLLSEPKNAILGTQPVVVTKAVDDTGANLIVGDDQHNRVSYYLAQNYRVHNQYLNVTLGKPGREATVIKELRGKVKLTLLAGTKPELTIEKLPTIKKKSFVSRTTELTIDTVSEPNEGGFSVTLSAKYLQPNHEDYGWANSIYQRLEAYDEKGEKFVTHGATNMTQGPGTVSMVLPFAPRPGKTMAAPAKLVLVEWLAVPREVEFAFLNVPLP